MLIAVAPHERLRGVAQPGLDGHTFDWREPNGSPGNTRGIEPAYVVTHLDRALHDEHTTDAHLVAYVLRRNGAPLLRQPRIRKDGLEWVREQGFEVTLEVLVVDVDNPGHAPWADAAAAISEVNRVKWRCPTAAVYASRAGLRIAQPVRRALVPEEAEGVLATYLGQLEGLGLAPDRGCLDWTRHFRLPHVMRRGVGFSRSPRMHTSCEPIEPPAFGRTLRRGGHRPNRVPSLYSGVVRPEGPITWTTELPGPISRLVGPLAAALLEVQGPTPSWHDTHLAIAGALARRGVDPAHLPALALAIAHATSDSRPEDRLEGARTTAKNYAAGRELRGRAWLQANAPSVARAIDELLGPVRLVAIEAPPPQPGDLPEVVALQIQDAVRRAPDGLSLVQVPCGTGKTRSLRVVAAERARKAHTTPGDHARAPYGSRTCISVPTHELAMQICRDLEAEGISCARLFGIASMRGPDGEPVCRFAGAAMALAAAGMSTRVELCEGRGRPCPHREGCAARDGIDGDPNARVIVGPHQLVSELEAMAGGTGLLAIDEPGSLLRTERYDLEDLDHALQLLDRFAPRYGTGLRPVLLAARGWLAGAPASGIGAGRLERAWAAGADPDALEAAWEQLGAESIETAAELAVTPPPAPGADPETEVRPRRVYEGPPLTQDAAFSSRHDVRTARDVGRAGRVLRDLREATIRPAVATIETTQQGRRVLVLTMVVEALRRAVQREGATVMLGADADLHRPLLAKAVGYEPPMRSVAAREGAPVRRVHLEAGASRARWIRGGQVVLSHVLEALRAGALELDRDGVRSALVVTYQAVEEALRASDEARQLLARVGGELAHFGALRGLDRWSRADGCLTLGDPRPNVGDVEREIAQIGEGASRQRGDELAAAELEQAHGRLRVIHRGPDRPATMVHVGELRPRGWYAPIETRPLGAIGPADIEGLRREVERIGGTTAAAMALGVDARSVRRWLDGARGPPSDALSRLRLVPSRTYCEAGE